MFRCGACRDCLIHRASLTRVSFISARELSPPRTIHGSSIGRLNRNFIRHYYRLATHRMTQLA